MTSRLPILLLAALLAGCAAGPAVWPTPDERAAIERRALSLKSEGRFREAAQEYLRLARSSDAPLSHDFVLGATLALIEEGDIVAARKLLTDVLPPKLDPVLEIRRTALSAEILLAEQRPYDALAILPPALRATAPPSLYFRIGDLRATALHDGGQYLAAIRERVLMDPNLSEPAQASKNRRGIWASISRLSPAELSEARPLPPDTLGGWLELGQIASSLMLDPAALAKEIELWQQRYPGHPAGPDIVPFVMELAREGAAPPAKLVLLLPLNGDFKSAAAAIRDGFLTAWFADDSNPRRPELIIRAVENDAVWSTYQQAVTEGAEFVVGPLERSAVDAIAAAVTLPVPTLALNYVSARTNPETMAVEGALGLEPPITEGLVSPEAAAPAPPETTEPHRLPDLLFQFSLSPEDEARAVAKRAWFDGLARAGVIAPEGQWGSRVVEAFVSEFERLGGQVQEVQQFSGDSADIGGAVEALLNIDASEERKRELIRALGKKVEFEAQRREDLDFIFMAAFPVQARQLRPLFRFHHAEALPVYATSHVYAGMPDPEADIDIDGVIFADMPWAVAAETIALRDSVVSTWREALPTYLRLYAFGADAYGLVPRLRALRAQPYVEYAGATGSLSVDAKNRIDRRLLWVQFKQGVPQPVSSSEAPQ